MASIGNRRIFKCTGIKDMQARYSFQEGKYVKTKIDT